MYPTVYIVQWLLLSGQGKYGGGDQQLRASKGVQECRQGTEEG